MTPESFLPRFNNAKLKLGVLGVLEFKNGKYDVYVEVPRKIITSGRGRKLL